MQLEQINPPSHYYELTRAKYAEMHWTTDDITNLRPNWSRDRAKLWLEANSEEFAAIVREIASQQLDSLLDELVDY